MLGPRIKTDELTLNEEIEILSAELEIDFLDNNLEYDEYHIIFPEE
jgi:hypothetical protein